MQTNRGDEVEIEAGDTEGNYETEDFEEIVSALIIISLHRKVRKIYPQPLSVFVVPILETRSGRVQSRDDDQTTGPG